MRNKTLLFIALFQANFILAQIHTGIAVHSISGGYNGYESFVKEATDKLETVINSQQFKNGVLDSKFTKTNGYTNEEIYNLILLAKEKQGEGGSDYVIDLRLRTITLEKDGQKWLNNCELNSRTGTIGIDGLGDGETAICPQRLELWYQSHDVAQLASHYAHEYMHILGFSHNGLNKKKTLVYKIGDLIYDLIKDGL